MKKKILVSGSTGLLGSHLLIQLAASHDSILALYRDLNSIKEVEELFKFYGHEGHFSAIIWEKGDLLDVERIQDLLEGVDQVYHCAALVSFNPADAEQLYKVNVEGTRNILNGALAKGVNKFLHVSSTATIGSNTVNGLSSESTKYHKNDQHSFYAKSKYSSEREVWRAIEEGLESVIVNPSVIIGPGDPNKSSGAIFSSISNGLKFYTEGSNAFVDARDVASIMVELMNSDVHSERFLCIGENLKFKEVFDLISDEMGVKRPSIKANQPMTSIAWRILKILSLISGKTPKITSESARSSHRNIAYSNQKIKDQIAYEFIPISASIKNAVNFLKVNQKLK